MRCHGYSWLIKCRVVQQCRCTLLKSGQSVKHACCTSKLTLHLAKTVWMPPVCKMHKMSAINNFPTLGLQVGCIVRLHFYRHCSVIQLQLSHSRKDDIYPLSFVSFGHLHVCTLLIRLHTSWVARTLGPMWETAMISRSHK